MTRHTVTPGVSQPEGSPNGAGGQRVGGAPGSTVGGVARPAAAGWGLPLAVLVVGAFMSVLDTSIVTVALPAIQKQFGVTVEDSQWVVTAYTLMLGVVVPATAWLGDRFGLTRVYNLALLIFAAGSALCGLAWNLNSLVLFRILQAIPGGILPVITLSILLRIVPRDRLGAAMGLYGLGVVVAPAVGPTLGGYLVEYESWPLIFFINVPIGILGAVAAALVLPGFPGQAGRRFDVLGFLTVGGGLFALLLATTKGPDWGWDSYRILGLFTFSVLSLALFVVIELEVADPLLDIRIFRYRAFTHSMLLIAVLLVVLTTVLVYIPQFLQVYQGWGAFEGGLALLPQALVMAVLMPLAGRVYDRIGPRWPAAIGLVIIAVSTYALRTITIDTTREHVMWLLVGLGVGFGMAMMPVYTSGLAVLPVTQVNNGSAFNNVVQRVGGALGLAMLTAIFTAQSVQQLAGRAALVPGTAPPFNLGATASPFSGATAPPLNLTPTPSPLNLGPTAPPKLGGALTYMMTQTQANIGAMDDLFMIAAGLSALAALTALWLRSGPVPAAPAGFAAPPRQATSSASANGGPTGDGAVERDLMPSATAAGEGAQLDKPRG
jgi:EmrB/QacA subfamily drug resistance transporter